MVSRIHRLFGAYCISIGKSDECSAYRWTSFSAYRAREPSFYPDTLWKRALGFPHSPITLYNKYLFHDVHLQLNVIVLPVSDQVVWLARLGVLSVDLAQIRVLLDVD